MNNMGTAGAQRYAVRAGGRFVALGAGILRRQPATGQSSRTSYYFGSGQTGAHRQSQSTSRAFGGVWVPGDEAQQLIADAAQAGAPLDFLCWRDGLPAALVQRRGNGFMARALPALDSDGASAAGGAEGIRFTLVECGPRRPGTVYADDGEISFAPGVAL